MRNYIKNYLSLCSISFRLVWLQNVLISSKSIQFSKKKKFYVSAISPEKKCFNQKIIVICFPRSIRDDQYFRLCCTGSSLTVRSWKTGSVGASIWTGFWIWIAFGSASIAASICCRVCCWCSRRWRGKRWGPVSCRREGRAQASVSQFRSTNIC